MSFMMVINRRIMKFFFFNYNFTIDGINELYYCCC